MGSFREMVEFDELESFNWLKSKDKMSNVNVPRPSGLNANGQQQVPNMRDMRYGPRRPRDMSSGQKTIWVITTVVLVIVGITLGVAFGIPAGFLAIGLLIGLVLLAIACACSLGILNSVLACIGCKTYQFPQPAQDAEIPLAGQAPNQNDQFGGFFGMNSGGGMYSTAT